MKNGTKNYESNVLPVRRYNNRKLYNVEKSCYITLGELASEIKSGNSLNVVCKKTSNDITLSTLKSILNVCDFTEEELLELIRNHYKGDEEELKNAA